MEYGLGFSTENCLLPFPFKQADRRGWGRTNHEATAAQAASACRQREGKTQPADRSKPAGQKLKAGLELTSRTRARTGPCTDTNACSYVPVHGHNTVLRAHIRAMVQVEDTAAAGLVAACRPSGRWDAST